LTVETVVISSCWWRECGVMVAKTQYCAVLMSLGGWYKVTAYFLLLPLQPPPVSRTIKRRVTGRKRSDHTV